MSRQSIDGDGGKLAGASLLAAALTTVMQPVWVLDCDGRIRVANPAAAATLGYFIAQWLTGQTFQLLVGAAFIAMAAWALVPDKDDERAGKSNAGGIFLTTLVAFFLVEIGDKIVRSTVKEFLTSK